MTVLSFEAARTHLRAPPGQGVWEAWEMADLMRLYSALDRRGQVADFACGATEQDDPQFYLLGAGPDRACRLCVSRLHNHRRAWYVVETGSGDLVAEGGRLAPLVDGLCRDRAALGRHWLLAAPAVELLPADDGGLAEALAGMVQMAASWGAGLLALA